ncbi:MAG: radical SAM domain-containing protein [Parcubacteria group bacterium Licking1014_17]|nr:MAG: radical SAM domain-containing protein [Parcubacteria group bacterium Licking1014_17]
MNKKELVPKVVSLRITARCSRKCLHCFAPKNVPEMDLSTLKRVFSVLKINGAESILLTGGEPTIRNDFPEVMFHLKKSGFDVFLDTNADFFLSYQDLICCNVDVIGLPVMNAQRRDADRIFSALEYMATISKRPIIRVGHDLKAIGNLIRRYPVSIWKLYQFTPQENAILSRHLFEVTDDSFNEAVTTIREEFQNSFSVVVSRRNDRNHAYFFVESDGQVTIPEDDMNICRLVPLGNIFDPDIFDKWRQVVSKTCYLDNIIRTFSKS